MALKVDIFCIRADPLHIVIFEGVIEVRCGPSTICLSLYLLRIQISAVNRIEHLDYRMKKAATVHRKFDPDLVTICVLDSHCHRVA